MVFDYSGLLLSNLTGMNKRVLKWWHNKHGDLFQCYISHKYLKLYTVIRVFDSGWGLFLFIPFEPCHQWTAKITFRHARPSKINIRTFWPEISLGLVSTAKDANFLHAKNEESDQTARMRRLIISLRRVHISEGTFSDVATSISVLYSRTSIARIRMFRLLWFIRNRSLVPTKFFRYLQKTNILGNFLILSWICMLCVLFRIASSRRF